MFKVGTRQRIKTAYACSVVCSYSDLILTQTHSLYLRNRHSIIHE